MTDLIIKPYNEAKNKQDEHRKPRYEQVPQPFLRTMILAPSAGGKTTLLSRLLIDIYTGIFDKIFIYSKTALIDPSYKKIFEYIKQTNDEKNGTDYNINDYVFSDVDTLERIMNNQHLLTRYANDKGIYAPKILIVFDDFLHQPENANNKFINSLILYRHIQISVIYLCQRIIYCRPTIRINLTSLIIFKQANSQDIKEISDEYRGFLSHAQFMDIYKKATDAPYSFLYINLNNGIPDHKKFMKNFESYLYFK